MKLLLSCLITLVAVCRLAEGGEGAASAAVDPMRMLFRLLSDFGGLGAFIIFLVWDRKKERENRNEDSKRWQELARELVNLVRECTRVIAENTSVLTELRRDVWRFIRKNGHRPGNSESDVWRAGKNGESNENEKRGGPR